MIHKNGVDCTRCAAMLEEAHPDIHYWFHRIKEHFPTAHCAYVFRGKEEQDKMVAEKKSLLKWPHSRHNYMEGDKKLSRAMDLFTLQDDGKAEFRMGFYVQVANWLDDVGAPITWGGHFRKLIDGPHFELKD
jgi:hypothetical protein